ncbi:MAG: DUF58 domain-containing protein [Ruminococcaceae bacterium]|nr:DUF58 domain-containing protein [Oscillospiraceae bacterium]
MARNRVLYVLTVVGCIIFSMAYTSKISAVLLFAVLLYPVAAAVFAFVLLLGVKAEFTTNRIVTDKNEPFDISITLKNNSILPGVPVEVYCHIPDREVGLFADKRVFASISPLGQARLSINCVHKYRGSFTCRVHSLSFVDPLRIVRLTKKQKLAMPTIFLPRKLKLADILSTSAGEQSFSPKKPITSEREDFSHVRSYREGDIMQLVHWKLTAKQDELMIKQFDSVNDVHAAVLCDFNLYPGECNVMLRSDTVIETALAFVREAVNKGIYCSVETGELSLHDPVSVYDEPTFNRFFEFMSVIPARLDVADFIYTIDNVDLETTSAIIMITTELSDELLARAKAAAQHTAVFYAYINLSLRDLPRDFSEDQLVFLNIRRAGERGLHAAAEHINDD